MTIDDYGKAVLKNWRSTILKQKDSKTPLQDTGNLTSLFFREVLGDTAKSMKAAMATGKAAVYVGYTARTLDEEALDFTQRGN